MLGEDVAGASHLIRGREERLYMYVSIATEINDRIQHAGRPHWPPSFYAPDNSAISLVLLLCPPFAYNVLTELGKRMGARC